jgi:hypothetical protein
MNLRRREPIQLRPGPALRLRGPRPEQAARPENDAGESNLTPLFPMNRLNSDNLDPANEARIDKALRDGPPATNRARAVPAGAHPASMSTWGSPAGRRRTGHATSPPIRSDRAYQSPGGFARNAVAKVIILAAAAGSSGHIRGRICGCEQDRPPPHPRR